MMPPGMAQAAGGAQPAGAKGGAGDASCATGSSGGQTAKTQEFGKAGAKVEILALIPVAHGCHAASEAQLKKAYEAHQKDVHLTIVDTQGPDAAKYRSKVKVSWTVISINGKSEFRVNGKQVQLEKAEGMSYQPADLLPIIEDQLKAKSA
jgi:hypothetical protein